MAGDELAGFFEYHTVDVVLERLESLVRDLGEGRLEHHRILEEGGHGAYVRKTVGFDDDDVIRLAFIDQVHHGGHGRGFAATRRAGEQHQAPVIFGKALKIFGQPEFGQRGGCRPDGAEHGV